MRGDDPSEDYDGGWEKMQEHGHDLGDYILELDEYMHEATKPNDTQGHTPAHHGDWNRGRGKRRPTWQLVLEVAESLRAINHVTFSLADLVAGVQRIDPSRARGAIQPVIQGMTLNATGGPLQPCGKVLMRVQQGWYRLLSGDERQRANSHPKPDNPRLAVQPIRSGLLAEDEVKAAVGGYLMSFGAHVHVAWGHERGVDIEARWVVEGTGQVCERQLIEAKGEASLQPQQVNYFLGALGELVQRFEDPDASYGLALPDNPQYRRLVERLPLHARRCLKLTVYFVSRGDNGGLVVRFNHTPPPGGDPDEDKAIADHLTLYDLSMAKEVSLESVRRVLRDRPSGWCHDPQYRNPLLGGDSPPLP
jgi:hypothetical protein